MKVDNIILRVEQTMVGVWGFYPDKDTIRSFWERCLCMWFGGEPAYDAVSNFSSAEDSETE